MINVCYENDPFHDPSEVIIIYYYIWMAVSEVVDDDNDNQSPLAIPLVKFMSNLNDVLSMCN